jgi:hypothetical protein
MCDLYHQRAWCYECVPGTDPSVYDMMKHMRAEKASAEKVTKPKPYQE